MRKKTDFDDQYIYTHGGGTHDFPITPFSTDLEDFIRLDFNNIRTERYTNNHVGKHILFAGCSVTHGVGLSDTNKIWTNIVYETIKANETVSGFYSIAYPAHSISMQVSLIFRYIAKYGKPDIIFFNMPSTGRTFSTEDNKIYLSQIAAQHETEYPGSLLLTKYHNFESYFVLDSYCKSNGIKLISFSWSDNETLSDPGVTQELFKDKFDSFYINPMSMQDFLENYLLKNAGDNELLANDGNHPGYGPHAYYAHTALSAYYA